MPSGPPRGRQPPPYRQRNLPKVVFVLSIAVLVLVIEFRDLFDRRLADAGNLDRHSGPHGNHSFQPSDFATFKVEAPDSTESR